MCCHKLSSASVFLGGSLKCCLIFWVYFKLVSSLLVFGWLIIWFAGFVLFNHEKQIVIILLAIATIFTNLFDIVFNTALTVGVHKKNTTLMRVFCRFGIWHSVLWTSLISFWIMLIARFSDEIAVEKEAIHYIVLTTASVTFLLVLHICLLIMVRSELLKMKASYDLQFLYSASGTTLNTTDKDIEI